MIRQLLFGMEKRTIELNCAHQIVNFGLIREIELYRLNEMLNIDSNFDEHVHCFPPCLGNGHQTRMPIMHEQITIELIAGNIVNAAGSVCNITQNHSI